MERRTEFLRLGRLSPGEPGASSVGGSGRRTDFLGMDDCRGSLSRIEPNLVQRAIVAVRRYLIASKMQCRTDFSMFR